MKKIKARDIVDSDRIDVLQQRVEDNINKFNKAWSKTSLESKPLFDPFF